jgi:hypothetical protein
MVTRIVFMSPVEFGLVRFIYTLAEQGLIDEVAFRGLCRANRLDPDDPAIRKGVYAALAERFLASGDEGALGLAQMQQAAERDAERGLR